MLSQAQPSLTANRSKPVRCAVPKRATIREKNIWGRKRHLLVDTQGHLLAVKVLGAQGSDQAGARVLCEPLKETFPSIKLVWGDSPYGGTFITWLKEQLGWTMHTVGGSTGPKRGLLVPAGRAVAW